MSVKHFLSSDTGAPVLTNAAGSLLSVMSACLETGYNTKQVQSITQVGGVATMTLGAGHGFRVNQRLLVAGANEAAYNGEQLVTAVSATTVTFAVPAGTAAAASGDMTVKVAPLGWRKAFTGTNKAAYTPASPQSLGMYLRVDDSGASARIRAYETMVDVDTGTGPYPTDSQSNGGGWWSKQNGGSTTAWAIVGDERLFYILLLPYGLSSGGALCAFGDILAAASQDAYANLLAASAEDFSYRGGLVWCDLAFPQGLGNGWFPRGYAQIGNPRSASWSSFGLPTSSKYSGSDGGSGNALALAFPNTPDNGVLVNPVHIGHDNALRGVMPGLYHTPQNWLGTFSHGKVIEGTDALAGRNLLVLQSGNPNGNLGTMGMVALDITGPWRV
ncbi:hypothetical protein [Ralstonia solanacearum]|uniref:hypothetical protein n=1 Tax=Ralstonia solanacearum TaxID=305 RepID=UPI00168B10F4|nr:hypothetical protein [Ralstonia solanacearum]QNT25373.1 hypothetical protein C2I38_25265 [Ralstonia solanacearum]QNT63020.1 hypothetical protein C2L97_25310 [Ralstonia solanacearum]